MGFSNFFLDTDRKMYGYSIGTASEMIEKLRDEIAKNKKLVEELMKRALKIKKKRIGELEKKFTMDDDLFAEMNTNKSEDAQNFGVDHAFVKGIDSTKHALIEQVMHFSRPKRTITSGKDTVYTLITN